ncbi:MAG: NYN domain-containing protein [Coriobacteriia bacterium]|nr:NYN domain-containing protein [Coriobacteriia bacterium]
MLFLVDGYNVTYRDSATGSLSLENQRDTLVSRLRTRGRDILGAGRIVVVFDGQDGAGVSNAGGAPVEVVFSRNRSADDEIVSIASKAAEKVVVVSDDRELAERVRVHARCGIEVRDASVCFEGAPKAKRRTVSRASVARDAGHPKGAHAITRELKELWLSEEDL